jgi:DNA polymerase-3 subunit beta
VLSDEKIPPIKVDEKVRYGEIEAGLLSELIKRSIYAVSDDRTRDVLRGILIEGEKDKVRMVATDGHRLAFVEKDGVFGKNDELKKKTIVPKKGAREIRRLAMELKNDVVVKMGFSDKNVTITEGGETLIVRLIEGEFPDYRIVIPRDNNIHITVKIKSFIESLKRATLLTEEETKVVKFFCKHGVMVISSKKLGVGEATEEMEVECTGYAVEFGLNSRYVLDVLNTMEGEDAVIEVKDGQTPILIKEKGQENIFAIIMPMML